MEPSPKGAGGEAGAAVDCEAPARGSDVRAARVPGGTPGGEGPRASSYWDGSRRQGSALRHLPNLISAIRGLLVIPIVLYTVSAGSEVPVVALGFLALAWVSDALDGWLARRLDAQSELGRILDPLADKVVIGGTALALWITGQIPGWLTLVILARDVAILGFGVPMRARVGCAPRSNPVGKAALVILVITLAAYLLRLEPVTDVLRWVTLAALVVSAVSYGHRFLLLMKQGEGGKQDRIQREIHWTVRP